VRPRVAIQPGLVEKTENRKTFEKNPPKVLEDEKDASGLDDDEKSNYSVLINSLKNIVEPKKSESKEPAEDDNFAEDEKDRVYAK
jgi:hypothetical protein